ncbi:MAG: cell division protein FtsA [Chitinispirillales bacterium]|jgi:cell division protein FtsA|nr:cell division protein FtsA [Chitinispirillales bacterium]
MDRYIVAIDIGSETVKTAIANKDDDGILHILGYAVAPTEGFEYGNVKNMDKLKNSIMTSVDEAQQKWGEFIDTSVMPIYYSISGNKITDRNIESDSWPIKNVDSNTGRGSVSSEDIEWHKRHLETSIIPRGQKMISMILQCFAVDENVSIENPIGLSGQSMKAAGHIIIDSESHINDLENAIKKSFFEDFESVTDADIKLIPVASGYASCLAVLTEEQKETGVGLLDIGDSCSDLSVFANKYPIKTYTNYIAGTTVTKDIMSLLGICESEVEKIKKECACANPSKTGSKEYVEIISHDGEKKELKLETLASLVNAPIKELFENIRNTLDCNIDNTTYRKIISNNGIILTGGTANLREIASVAMEVLEVPTKIGKPKAKKINEFPEINEDTSFSTLIGLCIYGTNDFTIAGTIKKKKKSTKFKQNGSKNIAGNFFINLWETLKKIQIS